MTRTGARGDRQRAAAPARDAERGGREAARSDGRLMLILFAVALLVYVPAIWWGIPAVNDPTRLRTWNSDELAPLGPISELYSVFVRRGPPFNPQYPLFHYMVQALLVGPYFALLWLTGGLRNPVDVYPFGLTDPRETLVVATVLARSFSLLMAAAVVVIAFRTGTILRDRTTGLAAAIVVLFSYSMVYYARTSNVDMPALFWTALGLALYARWLDAGLDARRAALLGAVIALGAATKDATYAPLVLAAAVLLVREWRARPGAHGRRRVLAIAAAGLGSLVLVYLPASGMVFQFDRYVTHVQFITQGSPAGRGSLYHFSTPASLAGYLGLLAKTGRHIAESLGAPASALAAAGLLLAAVRSRRLLLFALPAVAVVLAVIMPVRYVLLRFTMPIAYILAFFAAYVVVEAARASRPWLRVAARAAFLGAVAWSALRAADLTHQMLFDSRYRVEAWLAERLAPGEPVGYIGTADARPRLDPSHPAIPMSGEGSTSAQPRYTVVMLLAYRNHDLLPQSAAGTPASTAIREGVPGYEPVERFEPRTLFRSRPHAPVNPLVVIYERRAPASGD